MEKLTKLIRASSFILNDNEFKTDKTYYDNNGALYQDCECGGCEHCKTAAIENFALYIGELKDIDLTINLF
jgi:hypothetical protein